MYDNRLNNMYDNIGRKIKGLAVASAILMIIASVIGGIWIMSFDYDWFLVGLLVMVMGSLLGWISSWILYGFGELIENTTELKKSIQRQMKNTGTTQKPKDDNLPEL